MPKPSKIPQDKRITSALQETCAKTSMTSKIPQDKNKNSATQETYLPISNLQDLPKIPQDKLKTSASQERFDNI